MALPDDDYIDLDSDEEDYCSDDNQPEEEDAVQRLLRQASGDILPPTRDTADDFEREMDAELEAKIQSMPAPNAASSSKGASKSAAPLANDFYDDSLDTEDQQYVDSLRRRYLAKSTTDDDASATSSSSALPQSDANLTCPACMTQLCYDCQRHERYTNQYRAMFVFNCNVDRTHLVRHRKQSRKSQKSEGERLEVDSANRVGGDLFHPVKCRQCSTEVAMFDADEVYHFFNVLASHP